MDFLVLLWLSDWMPAREEVKSGCNGDPVYPRMQQQTALINGVCVRFRSSSPAIWNIREGQVPG